LNGYVTLTLWDVGLEGEGGEGCGVQKLTPFDSWVMWMQVQGRRVEIAAVARTNEQRVMLCCGGGRSEMGLACGCASSGGEV
jgi:hypothetical protein